MPQTDYEFYTHLLCLTYEGHVSSFDYEVTPAAGLAIAQVLNEAEPFDEINLAHRHGRVSFYKHELKSWLIVAKVDLN